jgi:hypothetical protein
VSVLAASLATDIGVPGANGMNIVGVFKFLDAVIMISRRRGIPVHKISRHIMLCYIMRYRLLSILDVEVDLHRQGRRDEKE